MKSRIRNYEIIIEADESDDFIMPLMTAFNLTFEELDLRSGMTLQELMDNINARLGKEASNECATQIVFYKVRNILEKDFGIRKKEIEPAAEISKIIPTDKRREILRHIEKKLEIKTNYLQAPPWIQIPLFLSLFFGLASFFYSFLIAIPTLSFTIPSLIIASKTGRHLPMKTLGEFIERITTDNFIKLTGDRKSLNKTDIKMVIIKILDDLKGLESLKFDPEQRLIFK